MLSNKEIICPNNLLDVAHTKKNVKAPRPLVSREAAFGEQHRITGKNRKNDRRMADSSSDVSSAKLLVTEQNETPSKLKCT